MHEILPDVWSRVAARCSGTSVAPQYHRVAEAIDAEIRGGTLPPQTLLPSERELAAALGTTPWIMKRAIGQLVRSGLVATAKGIGTRVLAAPVPRSASALREELPAAAGVTVHRCVRISEQPVPADVAHELGIEGGGGESSSGGDRGDPVGRASGVGRADRADRVRAGDARATTVVRILATGDAPIAQLTSHLPDWLDVDADTVAQFGLYDALTFQNARPTRSTDEVTARPASGAERAALELAPEQWLLQLTRRTYDHQGRCIERASHVYRPESFTLLRVQSV